MIRFQVQITIDAKDDALQYKGNTVTEEELGRLIKSLVYDNTNTYDTDIEVSVVRFYGKDE